jgi:type VI secretion system protein ImpH
MEDAPVVPQELTEELQEDPNSFGFFQAVRILQDARPDREKVGRFVDPTREAVRFGVQRGIGFPASEIQALDAEGDRPARMRVNFMGLIGPMGVLPHHYTLLASERGRARDSAYGDFLDLFHHRLISLFYRAWEKTRFDRHAEEGEDPLRAHLLDLVGAGVPEQRAGLPFEEDALLYYAGLLSAATRSAVALQQLLEDYFEVPVEVREFEGGWYGLPERDLCELGDDSGSASRLGRGAVVGDEIWDPQSRVRIRIGPLELAEYERFLPSGDSFERLRGMTRYFSNEEQEFELQLVLAQSSVPGFVVGNDAWEQPLGWSTWLSSGQFARDADDTIIRL